MNKSFKKRLDNAVQSLHKCDLGLPKWGLILGSGLGSFLDSIDGVEIPYSDIESFPHAGVKGHKGVLKAGKKVLVCAGRFHYYEGFEGDDLVFPVFLLHALGVENLVITNAAGGISDSYTPGDLVLIEDHINLLGMNPLRGWYPPDLGPRFPDMSRVYSPALMDAFEEALGESLERGVYAALSGPTYETPAEIRMLRTLGAHMVGMSTVPEAIAASFLGLNLLGISCITNKAAGLGNESLSHDDVMVMGKKGAEKLSRGLIKLISSII